MKTKNYQEIDCEEFRTLMIKYINDLKCEEIEKIGKTYKFIFFNNDSFLSKDFKPESKENYNTYRGIYKDYYYDNNNKSKLKENFTIDFNDLNSVVNSNNSKTYMHIFFINEVIAGENELSILLRFSNIETFDNSNIELNKDEDLYLLSGKNLKKYDLNKTIKELIYDYENNILKKIKNINPSKNKNPTYYITYLMSDINSFKGFEHDITFELCCKYDDNGNIRIALITKIKDKDKVHPFPILRDDKTGFYDMGDLKP